MPTWDYANISEVVIERPAKDVWPFFFDKKDRWTTGAYKTMAGEPGKVGEIYMFERDSHGERLCSFFEAIKVTPEKHLVLKITHQRKQEIERRLVGYDIVTVKEAAGRTTVTLLQALAMPVPDIDLALETERQDQMLAGLLRKLKLVAEGS